MRITNTLGQIKSAMSYNNNFFICFTVLSSGLYIPSCYINDYLTNNFTEISCKYVNSYNGGYKVLYFKETDEFMFISRIDLTTTIVNILTFQQKIVVKIMFSVDRKIFIL